MKTYISNITEKIKFWNFFIGFVIGFAFGVIFINALVPDSAELIRMYRLDYNSLQEDRVVRGQAGTSSQLMPK